MSKLTSLPLIDTVPRFPGSFDRRQARVFMFGEAESEFLGRLIRDFGPDVIHNREFAIPPFDTCYVEFDGPAVHRGLGVETFRPSFDPEGLENDTRVGFVCFDRQIMTVSANEASPKGGLGLFGYQRVVDMTADERASHIERGRMASDNYALFLGSDLDRVSDEERRVINTEWRVFSPHAKDKKTAQAISAQWQCAAGELRIFWAALLLLNRPGRLIEKQAIPAVSGIYRGKRRVFSAHTRVVLGAETKVKSLTKAMGLADRQSPRRHEVRGHFVHYELGDRCEHDWEPLTLAPVKRWSCASCGGRRVWRKQFDRGDATKGYKTKDYVVGVPT